MADAFDAMTTRRPYCDPMSVQDALGELLKGAGRQFDLACVEAMAEAVGSGKLADVLPAAETAATAAAN